jgi:hypothetical protein
MRPRLAFYIAATFPLVAGPGLAQCLSAPSALINGPVRKYAGAYRNLAYGFSTVIPRGFIGLDTQNPDYQRGFTISFHNWNASLTVSAEANSLEYADARAAAAGDVELRRRPGREALSSDLEPSELDGRPAEALRVRYRCSPGGAEYTWAETIALSPDGGYVYAISWEGPSSEFDSDRVAVDELKRSWKFLKPR